MLDLIRQWLTGITCAAMVVALAEGLMPPGSVRKIGRLTGGLVLLTAVLKPVLAMDTAALERSMAEYTWNLSAYSTQLEEENAALMKSIIEEQAAAYIVDKAEALGLSCTVQVEAGGGGEWPVPWRVAVTGDLDEAGQSALTACIAADFSIPEERQIYKGTQYYESGDGA